MAAGRYSLFDSAFGRCGLAWNERGLLSVSLPGADDQATCTQLLRRERELQRSDSGWPAFVSQAVAHMQAHLGGLPRDLREVPLDWSGMHDFERRVCEAARALDPGRTCTYGEMARDLGEPAAMRAVGQALGHNPWPLLVPCHRVLAAGGKLGGFSAPGGSDTKRRLLVLEAGMVRREGELF
jgi:methylated-DNA-[protein]-cysteine S-methyltransferase